MFLNPSPFLFFLIHQFFSFLNSPLCSFSSPAAIGFTCTVICKWIAYFCQIRCWHFEWSVSLPPILGLCLFLSLSVPVSLKMTKSDMKNIVFIMNIPFSLKSNVVQHIKNIWCTKASVNRIYAQTCIQKYSTFWRNCQTWKPEQPTFLSISRLN